MKLMKISLVIAVFAIFLVGCVSADTHLTVGGDWIGYSVDDSGVASGNHFMYGSDLPTHVMVADAKCVGGQPAVYDISGNVLGTGSPVTADLTCKLAASDGDTAYAGPWSHTCVNMPYKVKSAITIDTGVISAYTTDADAAYAIYSFDVKYSQLWMKGSGDGVFVKVEEGACPTVNPVPEFPTLALPAALIIGMLGVVLFVKRPKEE